MGGEWGQDKFSVILVGGSSLRGGWKESRGCFDGAGRLKQWCQVALRGLLRTEV